ncbi:alkyl hydroperoxide reductase AhpD [Pilimelia terevasa]|uniref:Alkyl hydroperoxide reductase AhpD n=1 Tax=Pilimelia terevasa TaxID=53372 RepID=A0A8J3BTH2_9ACTN|nr:carboxymuconolactone decarboxylase family protein [Pilimelia terevasa]GGK38541.1 alkyl hydroperoxide reductase AhpD [Pilimelia terevasa]
MSGDGAGIAGIRAALPAYAKDIKLNLGAVLDATTLTPTQAWGSALACAVAARNAALLRAVAETAAAHVPPPVLTAAKAAAAVMAMNNIYYRATHLVGDAAYQAIPARLRMQAIATAPREAGVDKADFELWCLAVSAVTGCGTCVESHERTVRGAGMSREQVHEALRIAAVVHAAAVVLDAEAALA